MTPSQSPSSLHHHVLVGKITSYCTVLLLVAYLVTTALGLASMPSPDDPIPDPYFTLMEVLIIIMMPPLLTSIAAWLLVSNTKQHLWGILSIFMFVVATTITCSVHAAVLVANRSYLKDIMTSSTGEQLELYNYLFSFRWPSVVYALDILAWDWFFALGLLLAAVAMPPCQNKFDRMMQVLLWTSGLLSLLGLIAIPLNNIQVRMIGIFGYAVVTIPLFVLMGITMGSSLSVPQDKDNTDAPQHDATNLEQDTGCIFE